MPDYYGLPQAGTGGVPAGGDADVGYFIMQAPIDKHLRVVALDWEGGDSGEDQYHFFIWPAGTVFPTTATNAVCWASGAIGLATAFPQSLLTNFIRSECGFNVIPAGWSLGMITNAGSTAALTVNVVGLPFNAEN